MGIEVESEVLLVVLNVLAPLLGAGTLWATARIMKKVKLTHHEVERASEQVNNDHNSNLRDDIDIINNKVDLLLLFMGRSRRYKKWMKTQQKPKQ